MVCSIMFMSTGDSTTQSTVGSRRGEAQRLQISLSAKLLQRWQCWSLQGLPHSLAQPGRPRTIVLKQVAGRPCAGRFGADPGQTAQGLDERLPGWSESTLGSEGQLELGKVQSGGKAGHFSWDSASPRRTASLSAAATRSSSISRSSITEGSMADPPHGMGAGHHHLTMPAPAWPSTSVWASCSCAFSCFPASSGPVSSAQRFHLSSCHFSVR